jgi:hypothetical protein
MSRQLLIVVALALLSAACASRQGGNRTDAEQPADIIIEAVNDNYYDARVHAIYAGGRRRSLGTIPGNGGRTQISLGWEPRALVFHVSFIIDGAAYASYPVDVTPGQHVMLRLPPNIRESGHFRRLSGS